MPRRWPRPHGTSVSSARTPRSSRSLDRGAAERRRRRGGGRAQRAALERRRPPSIGRPRPSSTRPSSSARPAARTACRSSSTAFPGPTPCSSPSGISSVRPSRKPTTSAGIGSAGCGRTRRSRPRRSTRAGRWPRSRGRSGSRRGRGGRAGRTRSDRVGARSSTPSVMRRRRRRRRGRSPPRARAGCGGAVDLGLVRVHDAAAAATRRSGTTSTRARPRLGDAGDRALTSSRSSGFTSTTTRPRSCRPRSAPRDDVDDELGPDVERGADDLLGERDRQLGGLPLDVLAIAAAPRRRAARDGGERRLGGGDAGAALLEPRRVPGLAARCLGRGRDGLGGRAGVRDDLRGPLGRARAPDRDGTPRAREVEGLHALDHDVSSSPPREMTISPASSSLRTAATIFVCASSITRRRCGCMNSISSRSMSAPREDMLAMIRSLTSSSRRAARARGPSCRRPSAPAGSSGRRA